MRNIHQRNMHYSCYPHLNMSKVSSLKEKKYCNKQNALVLYCCCNKSSQIQWPKTTQMYYHSGGQNSKIGLMGLKRRCVSRAEFLLESLEEKLFSCLFQPLEVFCIPWLMASSSIPKACHSELCFHCDIFSDLAFHLYSRGPLCLLCLHPTQDNPGYPPISRS